MKFFTSSEFVFASKFTRSITAGEKLFHPSIFKKYSSETIAAYNERSVPLAPVFKYPVIIKDFSSPLFGLVVIVIAGILVIYNIFYISIINSIKEYGQLRTIGMTAKQIQRLVLREGTLLMLPAIPVGLIAGIVVAYILIPHGFELWNVLWICPIVVALTYATCAYPSKNLLKLPRPFHP